MRSNQESNENKFKAQLKYETIDSNLDSAVENLFLMKHKDESIENTEELNSEFDGNVKCDVVELKIKFTNSSITKVKNEKDEISATSQVTQMTIVDQQTFFLPNNLADYFPQLTNLSITNSGLYGVDSSSFERLKSFEILVVNFNKVMQIPSDAFKDQENLRQLDMSFNKIKLISNGAFKSNKKLQELKLNDISLEIINDQTLEGLYSLKTLSLQNNEIKYLYL